MTPDDMERKVGLNVLASLPFDEEEDETTISENNNESIIILESTNWSYCCTR